MQYLGVSGVLFAAVTRLASGTESIMIGVLWRFFFFFVQGLFPHIERNNANLGE